MPKGEAIPGSDAVGMVWDSDLSLLASSLTYLSMSSFSFSSQIENIKGVGDLAILPLIEI